MSDNRRRRELWKKRDRLMRRMKGVEGSQKSDDGMGEEENDMGGVRQG